MATLLAGAILLPKEPREIQIVVDIMFSSVFVCFRYFFEILLITRTLSHTKPTLYQHQFEFPAGLLVATWQQWWWPNSPMLLLCLNGSGSHYGHLPRAQRRSTGFSRVTFPKMQKSGTTITRIPKYFMETPAISSRGFSNGRIYV